MLGCSPTSCSWQDRECCPANSQTAIWLSFILTHGFVCLPPLPLPPPLLPVLQLLPERLLLRPGLLRQHAGGEHGGAGGAHEVGRDPVSVLHAALPLHELPGAPGQVRGATPKTEPSSEQQPELPE